MPFFDETAPPEPDEPVSPRRPWRDAREAALSPNEPAPAVDPPSIRLSSASDAEALSALALASKASWGYSAAFLDACRDELTISPEACDSGDVLTAVIGGVPVGFAQIGGEPPEGELLHLFIAPDRMGRGLGRMLLDAVRTRAQDRGFRGLRLDADPHAESFYTHVGARTVGTVPSGSIPGRTLPQMVLDLD